jgi:glycosyltransferase involved in cell wall biosynthesis
LIDHLDIGGAQRHVILLAESLAARGHKVALGFTGEPRLAPQAGVTQLKLGEDPVSRRADPTFETNAMAASRGFRPTVVHGHLFASTLAAARVAAFCEIPLVLSHHSNGTWQTDSDRWLLAASIEIANHHFAASQEIRQRLLALGVRPEMAEFLPNAVPLPRRPLARPSPGDSLRIGFLARFTADKEPEVLLQAMARLRKRHVPAQLLMHGGGELEDDIHAAVRALDLQDCVTVAGPIDDERRLYSQVDLICLSSQSEGMPLVILEAMGHGLPVIATRIGSIPLQVKDGQTGLLFEAGDAGALADHLEWMWLNPVERLRMGASGRRRVARCFSVSAMVGRVESVYDGLTAAHETARREPA